MGSYPTGGIAVTDSITPAEPGTRCEVCGTYGGDVAQVICQMEGPEGDGEYANVVYICSYCAAFIIQKVTGFRAYKTLESWYAVRAAHAKQRLAILESAGEESQTRD